MQMAESYPQNFSSKKANPIIFVVLGLFLIIVIYLVVNFSSGKTSFFGKAATSGILNVTSSRVFASPIAAQIGERIRISVFVLDNQSKGIPGKNVLVGCVDKLACDGAMVNFFPVQTTTDSVGQAIFDISAPVVGKYELQAQVEGILIPQTVVVSFQ